MGFYLGIDGGGTKTRCVIGDEKEVLATALSGGSNVVRAGEAVAREALPSAIRKACEEAAISPSQIDFACVGVAGAARPEVAAVIRRIVAELAPQLGGSRLKVVGDTEIALEAAFGAGPGIIVIAGTGSIAFGRNANGESTRAGGWGFAVSDEGSGQWIGRHAVSAVLRAHDEMRMTTLTTLILDAWKLADIDALVQRANATPPPEFPRLFPVVLHAADDGDTTAIALLERAGVELAGLAATAISRLASQPPHVPVATTGSVFRQSSQVRRVFYNELRLKFTEIEVGEDSVEPALGALAIARALAM